MKFPRFLLVLLLSATLAGADTIREALVNLCDPAKIATITSEQRGANPRARKICYWLERARLNGRDPAVEMREVMAAVYFSDLSQFTDWFRRWGIRRWWRRHGPLLWLG